MHPRDRIEYRSAALRAAGQWRDPEGGTGVAQGALPVVDVRSNDYLGLARRVVSRETANELATIGAGASRLVSGTWPSHLALEGEIAAWLGTEACLLFSSGYAANVGAVSALAGPGETVISDALNHASIIDGCRLSRAEVVVLPHGNVGALERALTDTNGVRWVVTETYFGMDGDTPDLRRIRDLCDAHSAALLVDEAHALGVFGPEGRGLCAEAGVSPDVLIGGMGKALGVQGGFVACSGTFRDWLWNRARSMVFSTGTSPVLSELARDQLRRVRGASAERERLKCVEARLVERLVSAGVAMTPGRHGPVVPVVLGSEASVLEAARVAAERGVYCQPIRPPTVPAGKSRLRISLRADLADADIELLADALVDVWERAQRERGALPAGGVSHELEAARVSTHGASQDGVHAVATARGGTLRGAVLGSGRPRSSPRKNAGVNEESSADVAGVSARSAVRHAEPPVARTPSGPPWVVLGTGTGVGKTFVSHALVEALAASGRPVAGLKPIETGLRDALPGTSDAARLAAVSFHVKLPSPHPLYGYPDAVAPSRAARTATDTIDLARIAAWARTAATRDAAPPTPNGAPALVVETAGGVFSPLSATATNLDLARELEPATWLLVAPDRLGVLHDVTCCLQAMASLGRRPDWLILSAPADPDPSTGTNAQELALLPGCPPIIELPRNDATLILRLLSPLAHPKNA